MGPAEPQTRRYTSDEYFALEAQSEVRHEYFEGEVFAMAGASKPHNLIKGNMIAGLRPGIRQRGCRLFDENVRLEVKKDKYYTYPDVLVSCDPADYHDLYLVRQPVLIIEILSPSTADYDRTTKFENYQKMPSLRHYLLISQSTWIVEWFRRDEAGQWIYTLLTGPEGVLAIPDLGLYPYANSTKTLTWPRCACCLAPRKAGRVPPWLIDTRVGYCRCCISA